MGMDAISTMQVFQYEESPELTPTWTGFGGLPAENAPSRTGVDESTQRALQERQHAEELRRNFEAGRARGLEEGRRAEHEAQAASRAEEEKQRTAQAARLAEKFAEERERYLHAVEHEVVQLSLAVAARILRREAQMDPLLLTGAVRVALGQLSNSTEVRLKVPPAELDLWREAIAHLPNLTVKPVVEPGDGMRTGDCAIETSVGSVDLGIRAQLAEIERGFFDRAGQAVRQAAPAAQGGETHA